jgi:hypothetical protein
MPDIKEKQRASREKDRSHNRQITTTSKELKEIDVGMPADTPNITYQNANCREAPKSQYPP